MALPVYASSWLRSAVNWKAGWQLNDGGRFFRIKGVGSPEFMMRPIV
jgi:hypothetical protein